MSKHFDNSLHLNTILNSVADGVFTVDERMRITSFNRAAEEITGFTKEEALGKCCHDVFRTDVCFTACPVKEAMQSGQPVVSREVLIFSKSGRKLPISVSASVLRNENGRPIGGVETFRDKTQLYALKQEIVAKFTFQNMSSRNPGMQRLFDVLPDIAASEATVLLRGESGTGKELFAQALHDLSPRKNGPLVVVNCGALPEPLLEAEIFGARKGAYTGAVENRPGRLEMASGGTLFLDEIGDLPLPLQVKLLRVLENQEYQPLGAKSPLRANVRFAAATNCDLEEMVEKGSFRRDLFFRINVVALQIPPLRERPEDIPLLLDLFLDRFNRTYGKKIRGFTPEAMQILLQHPYTGNVRELLNLVEQTVILCRGDEISIEHLPQGFLATVPERTPLGRTHQKRKMKRGDLEELLRLYDGNRTRIAKELGVDRTTLWRWMKRFDLLD